MQAYDLEKLSKVSKRLKLRGKKIGLCHGVFDLVHAGHISHFDEVKKKCDYLFVTITADKFVSKGPNRPINSHYFRAKVLAALRQVNFVGINYTDNAVKSIQTIKPDYYFKGKDYKDKKDLTLRLQKEKKAVIKCGGKIVFTESPLKSSTEIINKSFSNVFDSKLQKYLTKINKNNLLNDMIKSLNKAENLKALIIGDAIIDQYDSVTPLNKPPKENIIATRYKKSDIFLGGVFAAAMNLSQFNNNVEVCTVVGKDIDIKNKINNFTKKIKSKIFIEKNKITVRKKRLIEIGYNRKLSEEYYMDDDFLSISNLRKIKQYLNKNIHKFDVVILMDYGHGFINNEIYKILLKKSKFLAINSQTNSGNFGFNLITKYQKCDYVCIDEPELRLALSNKKDDVINILKDNLTKKIKCKNFTITRGRNGSTSYFKSKILHTPALISEKVLDTVGAGDVFLVITSLLYSAKANQLITNLAGNIAGALKVDILGHSKSINKSTFYSVLKHILK